MGDHTTHEQANFASLDYDLPDTSSTVPSSTGIWLRVYRQYDSRRDRLAFARSTHPRCCVETLAESFQIFFQCDQDAQILEIGSTAFQRSCFETEWKIDAPRGGKLGGRLLFVNSVGRFWRQAKDLHVSTCLISTGGMFGKAN